MLRSLAIALAAILLFALTSSEVIARGGGGGGHMGGGHMGGGMAGAHWSGGGHWGGGGRWAGHWGGQWGRPGFRHFAFHNRFRHGRFGPAFFGYAAAYDSGCWQIRPTVWGWQRVWVCGSPYYGYF